MPGRQSPSVQSKVKPKISSSPIVRRVRRSEASKTSLQPAGPGQYIKKSVSMDSVPSGELTDQDHRPKIQDQNLGEGEEEKFDELVKIIDKNGVSGSELSASYSTLPQSFSRSRNISRSLVPKMRKFFEKSRSCGPELHHPADGTESARSSFVLVAPGENPGDDLQETQATNSVTGSSLTLEDVTDERARQMKNKGFVNKCVVKVRSLMGRSQELDGGNPNK